MQTSLTWFTYEDKKKRPINIVIKYLPHLCQPDNIVDDLTGRELKALDTTNN